MRACLTRIVRFEAHDGEAVLGEQNGVLGGWVGVVAAAAQRRPVLAHVLQALLAVHRGGQGAHGQHAERAAVQVHRVGRGRCTE